MPLCVALSTILCGIIVFFAYNILLTQDNYDKEIDIDVNTLQDYNNKIDVRLLNQEYAEALSLIQEIKKILDRDDTFENEDKEACYITEIYLHLMLGNKEEAVRLTEAAYALDPRFYGTCIIVNLSNSKFERLIELTTGIMETYDLDDENAFLMHYVRLLAYLGQDDPESAAQEYTRLKKLFIKKAKAEHNERWKPFFEEIQQVIASKPGDYKIVVGDGPPPEPEKSTENPGKVSLIIDAKFDIFSKDGMLVYSGSVQ